MKEDNLFHYLFLLTAMCLCFSGPSVGAVMTLPVNGEVALINDDQNLLANDLGLNVGIGDSVTASFTMDHGLSPVSTSPGAIYNFDDPSLSFSAGFELGGNVASLNSYHRMTVWDNYASGEFGDFDLWQVSAAVGSGIDELGRNFFYILSLLLLDTGLDMHSSEDFYFVNDFSGWDYVGVTITTWYGDFNGENQILLSTIPAVRITEPGVLVLMVGGIALLFLRSRTRTT